MILLHKSLGFANQQVVAFPLGKVQIPRLSIQREFSSFKGTQDLQPRIIKVMNDHDLVLKQPW